MNRGAATVLLVGALASGACSATEVPSAGVAPTEVDGVGSASGPDFLPGAGSTTPGTDTAPTTLVIASTTTTVAPASTSTSTTSTTTIAPLTGWEAVDSYLDRTIIGGGSDAAALAVLRDGQLVHEAAFGTRVVGGAEPATVGLRFRIASISKMVTAVTALELVESGVIGLDDAVVGRVAERLGISVAPEIAAISVRHLLSHRSGFQQFENLFFGNEVDSCETAARTGLARPLQSVPGTDFEYSNLNVCVLGLAIEDLTGLEIEAATLDRTLAPLDLGGMRMAGTFDRTDVDVEHRSTAGRNYMETLGASGAWLATARDVVRLTDSLDPATATPSVLDPDTIRTMQTITTDAPQPVTDVATTTTVPPPPTSGYGLGLMIFDDEEWGHTGTIESTRAMTVRRADGYTWALLVSGDYPASTSALAAIMGNALLLGGFTDDTFVNPPPPLEPSG